MKEKGYILMSPREVDRLAVLEKVSAKQLTQAEAAKMLKLSRRQVVRICKRYQSDGAERLISKHRGNISNNKLPDETKEVALRGTGGYEKRTPLEIIARFANLSDQPL